MAQLDRGVMILDPDGWDRKNFEDSFEIELVDYTEFIRRRMRSTIQPLSSSAFDNQAIGRAGRYCFIDFPVFQTVRVCNPRSEFFARDGVVVWLRKKTFILVEFLHSDGHVEALEVFGPKDLIPI